MNLKPINTLQDLIDYLKHYPSNANIRFVLRSENLLLNYRHFIEAPIEPGYYILYERDKQLRSWAIPSNAALSTVLAQWGIQMLTILPLDTYNVALLTGDIYIPAKEIPDEDVLPF